MTGEKMLQIDKVFFINLALRTDRNEFMSSYLGEMGLPYERFDAVCPTIDSLVSPHGMHHNFYERATDRFKSYAANPSLHRRATGVFGCYISHYRIHEFAIENDIGNYIILEDDCQIQNSTLDKISAALQNGEIDADWDIIRSCWESSSRIEKFTASHHESDYSDGDGHSYFGGTHFSLFKGRSARKIFEHLANDRLLSIDAAYSTDNLNVYHSLFDVSIADLGTDIPKTEVPGWRKTISSKLRQLMTIAKN